MGNTDSNEPPRTFLSLSQSSPLPRFHSVASFLSQTPRGALFHVSRIGQTERLSRYITMKSWYVGCVELSPYRKCNVVLRLPVLGCVYLATWLPLWPRPWHGFSIAVARCVLAGDCLVAPFRNMSTISAEDITTPIYVFPLTFHRDSFTVKVTPVEIINENHGRKIR